MSEQLDIAEAYVSTFAGRRDVFAEFAGSWTCRREPLTAEHVIEAFRAQRPLSGYTVTAENTTHLAVYDFDAEEGLDQAKAVRAAMNTRGATAYVETSRRGAHLWSIMDDVLPRRTVLRAMRGFLGAALVSEGPKVEFRIAPRDLSPDQVGMCIRLPTMPNPKDGVRYPFLNHDDTDMSGSLRAILRSIEQSSADAFRDMAEKTAEPFDPRTIQPELRRSHPSTEPTGSASQILMEVWGVPRATPNHTIHCPAHEDDRPSLFIFRDDQRAVCESPGCVLHNDGRGRGTIELGRLAETHTLQAAR